jgi:acyl-CoA synthetase (NDP forming)
MTSPPSSLPPSSCALLEPRAVAVYGASATPGKLGHSVLVHLLQGGFVGEVLPVHPHANEIEGLACRPSLCAWRADRPGLAIDCVFLAVPAAAVPSALADCEQVGVGSVIIGSSGFAELGDDRGRERQEVVARWARRTGIRVLGPNTNGILSLPARLSLGYNAAHGQRLPSGPISVVSHSGALFDIVARRIVELGGGLSRFVPVGNEADISLNEVLGWLVDDPHTLAIGLVIEGLGDGEGFRSLCARARTLGKPVVALKIGRGVRAARATEAHSSRLAGATRAYEALFESAGVACVDTIEALAGACVLLAACPGRAPLIPGPALADPRWIAVTTSGAGGALIADMLAARGLDLAGGHDGRWPASVEQRLLALPAAAPIVSPIDMGSLGDWDLLEPTWAALEAEGFHGPTIAFAHRPASSAMAESLLRGLAGRRRRCPAPVVLLLPGGWEEALEERCRAAGLLVFRDTVACFDSLAAWSACVFGKAGRVPASCGMSRAVSGASPLGSGGSGSPFGRVLTELQSSQVLAAAGLPMVRSQRVEDLGQALGAARGIGFPVVLKAVAEGVAHKHALGLVEVDIGDETALERAMQAQRLQLARHQLAGPDNCWLVQPMLRGALEVIVGVTREPALGRFLLVGLGGLLAEEVDAVEVFPVDESADRISSRLEHSVLARMAARTCGSDARAALASVLAVVERLRSFALQHPSVESVDVNPLLLGPGLCVAVDALVIVRPGEALPTQDPSWENAQGPEATSVLTSRPGGIAGLLPPTSKRSSP